jgi:ATP-dependent DNA helicase DinG
MSTSLDYLGHEGAVSKALPSFKVRASQLAMAQAIERIILQNGALMVEAGTGTGKTLAYLFPALLSGRKVLISTGTKHLQDQLFLKDLPLVQNLLQRKRRVVLLKGRANYLCQYRLQHHVDDVLFASKRSLKDLAKVKAWAARTRVGDIAELDAVEEKSELWPHVTSSVDNCLGSECPCYDDCFLMKARRKVFEADVVVVNHHVFFADALLREEGDGELLPQSDVVIFDEAHQLIDIATQFFSTRFSSRQLAFILDDLILANSACGEDYAALPTSCERLKTVLMRMQDLLQDQSHRQSWAEVAHLPAIQSIVLDVAESLQALMDVVAAVAERHAGLALGLERLDAMLVLFKRLVAMKQQAEHVVWYEVFTRSFSLNVTPLDVAKNFSSWMAQENKAWVFTSATLSTQGHFEHFASSLGLHKAETLLLASPYCYQEQALLYLPRGQCDPHESAYIETMVTTILPLLEALSGRSFLLFTSYAAMERAREALKDSDFDLFVQGDGAKHQLLEKFAKTSRALLLGTQSFWQGVDVQGAALSCVVIDKLPFLSPKDPILQAKVAHLSRRGKSPFQCLQIPAAILQLKQGVGRLIRGEEESGLLIIADPRLSAREYGHDFLQSLAHMPISRCPKRVQAFIEEKIDETILCD